MNKGTVPQGGPQHHSSIFMQSNASSGQQPSQSMHASSQSPVGHMPSNITPNQIHLGTIGQ